MCVVQLNNLLMDTLVLIASLVGICCSLAAGLLLICFSFVNRKFSDCWLALVLLSSGGFSLLHFYVVPGEWLTSFSFVGIVGGSLGYVQAKNWSARGRIVVGMLINVLGLCAFLPALPGVGIVYSLTGTIDFAAFATGALIFTWCVRVRATPEAPAFVPAKPRFNETDQERVDHVKSLLSQPQALEYLTIEAIWPDAGFPSRAAFFATFKRLTGQTPYEFAYRADVTLYHTVTKKEAGAKELA